MKRLIVIVVFALAAYVSASPAKEPKRLLSNSDAEGFGSAPTLWNLRLSPSGRKISFVQMHPSGTSIAQVLDLDANTSNLIVAGEKDKFDITWCDWVSDTRLLCGFQGMVGAFGNPVSTTRMVAVNHDGSDQLVLLERLLRGQWAQFQDQIVDLMPNDPDHVLVELPGDNGTGVSRVNVNTGRTQTVERRNYYAYEWLADGAGNVRAYRSVSRSKRRWYLRPEPKAPWEVVHSIPLDEVNDSFSPAGFGTSSDELMFFDTHDGRLALFALRLDDFDNRRLVFAHDIYDVSSTISFGKEDRLVAVSYVDDRVRYHFFDETVRAIQKSLEAMFPGKLVGIFDESWDRRYYLVFVSSDRDPGYYYLFDTRERQLARIAAARQSLNGRELAPMEAVSHPADDGVPIPAYLTRPGNHDGPAPTVILPHGGPSSRDYWSFDFLAQYFAARGYVVLQSNYRGSSGYGLAWQGDGAFQGWRQAISDIDAGLDYLIEEGITDPNRVCAVGWSYGGYAALMSVIENPGRYQCVISIAGVTDPLTLGRQMLRFVGGRTSQVFIGEDDETTKTGSPLKRASEITVPTLLIHPEKDVNVDIDQSKKLYRALKRRSVETAFTEYKHAEHGIRPERYRIDLLARTSDFLDRHTAAENPTD